MEGGEWWYLSTDRSMPGDEVWPSVDDQETRGGRNLYLRTSGYVRLSGPSSGSIPPFSSARELNKRVGWDGAELVSTTCAEGTNE